MKAAEMLAALRDHIASISDEKFKSDHELSARFLKQYSREKHEVTIAIMSLIGAMVEPGKKMTREATIDLINDVIKSLNTCSN